MIYWAHNVWESESANMLKFGECTVRGKRSMLYSAQTTRVKVRVRLTVRVRVRVRGTVRVRIRVWLVSVLGSGLEVSIIMYNVVTSVQNTILNARPQ